MTAPLQPEVKVKFSATGVEGVNRGLKLVGSTGESTSRQVGGSMRQIAGGVEMIARQGKVTGEAIKQVVSQGAEMAFMFGAGGPIVGAIAIVGVAIYEHITNRMKEARDEINKARTELETLSRGDLMGAGKRQQQLYSGETGAIRKDGESAAAFLARSQGIGGVRSRIGTLAGQLPAGIRTGTLADAQAYALGGVPWNVRPGGIQKELIELYTELSKLNPQFEALTRITTNLATVEGDHSKNALKISTDEYLKNLPLSPAQIAAHGRTDALLGSTTLDPMNLRQFGANGRFGVHAIPSAGTLTTAPIGGLDGYRTFGLKPKELTHTFESQFVSPLAASITKSIGDGIGSAISSGFEAAFAKGANIGKVASAFGASALSTIGGVFKDIGMQSLIGLEFMNAIKVAITSWNPALGIAASIGLIALGSALQSAGGRMSANSAGGGGYGGGGGGGGSQPTIIDRGFINPAANSVSAAGGVAMRNMIVLAPTIIGTNDPNAQRSIKELIRNADARGGI